MRRAAMSVILTSQYPVRKRRAHGDHVPRPGYRPPREALRPSHRVGTSKFRPLAGPSGEGSRLPRCLRPSPAARSESTRRLVRGPHLRRPGWLLLPAGLRLARANRNADPRPHLLGSLLLRGGIGARRALRTLGRRLVARVRSPEEGVAAVLGQGGRGLDRASARRGHPQGWELWRQDGDLRAPLRPQGRRSGWPRLRRLPGLLLRPVGGLTRPEAPVTK